MAPKQDKGKGKRVRSPTLTSPPPDPSPSPPPQEPLTEDELRFIWANLGVCLDAFRNAAVAYGDAQDRAKVSFDLHEDLKYLGFPYPTQDVTSNPPPPQQAGPSSRPMESPASSHEPTTTTATRRKGRQAEPGPFKRFPLFDEDKVKLRRHCGDGVETGPWRMWKHQDDFRLCQKCLMRFQSQEKSKVKQEEEGTVKQQRETSPRPPLIGSRETGH
ncbi:hypothetical protein CF326_g6365 [Tilletia indica]|uniref:Uncharacterized protein n=1 Tax=Tilletia indica TaxID=43049 RepID=A0A8T8SLU4_9BASI|nr:hypothetical protein CF326_g6365 [Tilletia indica]KAE8241784.1 hypothetical protein A4X13_0g7266 [Tilletia indica]